MVEPGSNVHFKIVKIKLQVKKAIGLPSSVMRLFLRQSQNFVKQITKKGKTLLMHYLEFPSPRKLAPHKTYTPGTEAILLTATSL